MIVLSAVVTLLRMAVDLPPLSLYRKQKGTLDLPDYLILLVICLSFTVYFGINKANMRFLDICLACVFLSLLPLSFLGPSVYSSHTWVLVYF